MRALALLVLLAACGPRSDEAAPAPEEAEEAPAQAVEAVEAESDELAEPAIDEEEDTLPALGEAELDAMEQPELEAACFAGSTAACDRLGH